MIATALSVAGIALVLLPGCAVAQEGLLYQADGSRISRFRVANGWVASTDASAELGDGTTCQGRVSRMDAADNPSSPESPNVTSNRSVAVLVCGSTGVLRCGLVHRPADGYVFGECTDQRGLKYTLAF